MKAEQLKSWLQEATRGKYPDTEAWDKVMSVTQVAFRDGYIPEAMIWRKIVLILNGDREYRCIGLVEAIWKVCTSIVNYQLRSSIVIHDTLYAL